MRELKEKDLHRRRICAVKLAREEAKIDSKQQVSPKYHLIFAAYILLLRINHIDMVGFSESSSGFLVISLASKFNEKYDPNLKFMF